MNDVILRLDAVEKHFGATPAVHGVTLDITRGEFFALLGPSGWRRGCRVAPSQAGHATLQLPPTGGVV